ncbi:hypothetical protein LJK88_41495 [Paenibacillus sp. P26]|nr:hypothetical protein LJK88_41495 [Paenibacillus sp. P26]UUZ92730.1 hypothetical protein LJK87_46815 [Paenibacillus sp. P25]
MEKWCEHAEEQEMADIRRIIQKVEMPAGGYSDQIMKRIGAGKMNKGNSKLMKKVLVSASAAAALGVVVIGGSFVSPAMADSLKSIPLVSKLVNEITGKTYTYSSTGSWSMGEEGAQPIKRKARRTAKLC